MLVVWFCYFLWLPCKTCLLWPVFLLHNFGLGPPERQQTDVYVALLLPNTQSTSRQLHFSPRYANTSVNVTPTTLQSAARQQTLQSAAHQHPQSAAHQHFSPWYANTSVCGTPKLQSMSRKHFSLRHANQHFNPQHANTSVRCTPTLQSASRQPTLQ